MSAINENNYYVVEFLDLPYKNIEKYIIIPYSWIRILRPSGIIHVAFPKEDPKKTRERVQKNQKFGPNWQLYEAIVKYDSSNFHDTNLWISTMNIGLYGTRHLVIAETQMNNSADNSKNDVVASSNVVLSTNKDPAKEPNKSNSLLPKKRHKFINVEKISSAVTVSKPQMTIELKTELMKRSLKRKVALDSGAKNLKKKTKIAMSAKSAEDSSNCISTSSGNHVDEHSKNTVINLCTSENTKNNNSPTEFCMSPQNLSQRHLPITRVNSFPQDQKSTCREKRIDTTATMEAVRHVILQTILNLRHESKKSKPSIEKDDHSLEVPPKQEIPIGRFNLSPDIDLKPVLQNSTRKTSCTVEKSKNLKSNSHLQINGRLSPHIVKKPQSAVQNVIVLMNQQEQVSKKSQEQFYSETCDAQKQQQQRHSPTPTTVSQSVITKSPRPGENHKESPKSASSPVQCYPKDQTNQQSPENKRVSINFVRQVARYQGCAKFFENTHLQGVTKNKPPPVQNLTNQLTESPNLKPIVRGLLLQDPTTGVLFLRKSNNFQKKQTTERKSITLERKCAAYTDYILPKKCVEKCFLEKPNITDSSISNSQNTQSCQPNFTTHCCSSYKCFVGKQIFPPTANQPHEPAPEKQFSDASGNSLEHEMLPEKSPIEKVKYTNHNENSNVPKCNPQHIPIVEKKVPVTTKMTIDCKEMTEKMLKNEFESILSKININSDNKYESLTNLRNAFYEYGKIVQKVIKDFNDCCDWRVKEIQSINRQQTAPVVLSSLADTTMTRDNDQRDGNNHNHDDENNKSIKKPRSFILPPEHDPNDTRWTLKYQEPAPGIVELIPQSNVYLNEMPEKNLKNEFESILCKIDITLDNKNESLTNLCNAFYEYGKTILKVIKDVNYYCEWRMKEMESISRQQTAPVISSSPANTTMTRDNDQQGGNNHNHDDENNKSIKKPRSFTLPPEYDPNDTRWTLKYQEPAPGIVELIPRTKVYIKAHRLAYCKRISRDCKKLARLLLVEIFSSNALSVCSLTGARAKAFDLDGSDVRPGLDEHARMVLLTFVEDYGIRNRWCVFDTHSILNSIRRKLQGIRKTRTRRSDEY